MNVTDAILSRMSCRAFLDQPVPPDTLREILEAAKHAPSGGNLQPWHVHVLADRRLREFVALIRSKLPAEPQGEGTEYDIYPPNLKEPYRSRRFKCGEDLYATIPIAREDKPRRLAQFARNYEFFGAPAAMFFVIDRIMGADQWADVGMFMQNIMLLARARPAHLSAGVLGIVASHRDGIPGLACGADAVLRSCHRLSRRIGAHQPAAYRTRPTRRVRDLPHGLKRPLRRPRAQHTLASGAVNAGSATASRRRLKSRAAARFLAVRSRSLIGSSPQRHSIIRSTEQCS
jgi:nitroreductase